MFKNFFIHIPKRFRVDLFVCGSTPRFARQTFRARVTTSNIKTTSKVGVRAKLEIAADVVVVLGKKNERTTETARRRRSRVSRVPRRDSAPGPVVNDRDRLDRNTTTTTVLIMLNYEANVHSAYICVKITAALRKIN